MYLDQLLQAVSLPSSSSHKHLRINNIVFESKRVKKGDLFVAISGYHTDGHTFIGDAVDAGAVAVVGEKKLNDPPSVPYFRVPNARLALALLAAEFYGHPSRSHSMIGVTGTNGKTTTAYILRHILESAGQTCTLFSTVERCVNGRSYTSQMTTQDAVQLQKWIHESHDDNVVMEASSHGLSQSRVDGLTFDYAVFTNLSREHLDYHQSADSYFQAKSHLFDLLKPEGEAVVNTCSRWGRRLVNMLAAKNAPVLTYGTERGDALELVFAEEKSLKPTFHTRENQNIHRLKLPFPGFYNIMNAMAAILVARRKSIPFSVIAEALASFPGVPGRLETFKRSDGARFIIDYAHTPDGLLQCMKAMQAFKPKRLIHVFGFRGNRDAAKWEVMVRISKSFCDKTILTLDNLNGTPPDTMLQQYESFNGGGACIIADRTIAVQQAWADAAPGDCVIITGKGPEAYQQSFALPTNCDAETIQYLQKYSLNLTSS